MKARTNMATAISRHVAMRWEGREGGEIGEDILSKIKHISEMSETGCSLKLEKKNQM